MAFRRAARTHLYGLGTALPEHASPQESIHRFMTRLSHAAWGRGQSEARRLLDSVYAGSGIGARHSVLPDYLAESPELFEFYPPNWTLEPFPTTAQRMVTYERSSVDLAASAARRALAQAGARPEDVTHLIFTTCTGFFAPGPDILLMEALGLRRDLTRSVIGFMGCYAGFNGLRDADHALAADPEAVVLQVCLELCTLHFQKRPEPDFIVANSLFSDGASAAVYAAPGRFPKALARLVASKSRVAAGTLRQMSWRIGSTGFEMRLDREVPLQLGTAVPSFTDDLLGEAGLSRPDAAGWVLHPGGRRIVSAIQRALALDDEDVASAREVLRTCGNMSSATIFFVLKAELMTAPPGPLVALGFGPGLTMEGAVLEKL